MPRSTVRQRQTVRAEGNSRASGTLLLPTCKQYGDPELTVCGSVDYLELKLLMPT